MQALYSWVTAGLFVGAVAVLFLPLRGTPDGLLPTEIAYLRGGTRGAILTALSVLRADCLIAVRRRGGVRRTGQPMPAGRDPFQRAVYNALHTAAGPRSLMARREVRRARDAMVTRLTGAGLVAGRFRLMSGRAMLIAVPVVIVLASERIARGTAVLLGAAILAAVALWPLSSRRTVAGQRALGALRREHAHALAAWTPTEHEPHDASLDATLRVGTPVASGSLVATSIALGMVAVLVATTGIQVADDSSGFEDGGFDDSGGGFDGGEYAGH